MCCGAAAAAPSAALLRTPCLQASAGTRFLLRLPQLLRISLLLWLVYQSSERALPAGACLSASAAHGLALRVQY